MTYDYDDRDSTQLRGALDETDMANQLEMVANRIRKNLRKLKKPFEQQNIDVFRLYDWDIPEIRLVVDWYKGHLVVGEYQRQQTDGIEDWLPRMAEATASAINVPKENLHLKSRKTGGGNPGSRYERLGKNTEPMVVQERDLKFLVNLDDYIDTGVFSDHRNTRKEIRKISEGQRFLNLYAYTGTFTCAAVAGGAIASTTVDLSNNYLGWAEQNFSLNELPDGPHAFIKSDCLDFLFKAHREKKSWDLCVLDPPSFSTQHGNSSGFDILRDHPKLIEATISVMAPGGKIYFSTNHQRFTPRFGGLRCESIEEITHRTVPQDYRNKKIHQCWCISL